jgi:hypothetical protein
VREQFGGGTGETKVTRKQRGGLQDTGDRAADRVGPKRKP